MKYLVCLVLVGCGGSPFVPSFDGDVDSARISEQDAGAFDATPSSDGGGSSDSGQTPLECLPDLSGAVDFSIRFTLTTTAGAINMALLSQRVGCDETSSWWGVSYGPRTATAGAIQFGACASSAASCIALKQESDVRVNDGHSHAVVVTRANGKLRFSIDGVLAAGPVDAPDLQALPPLKIGTDDCPGFVPTEGVIADVCLTRP